MDGQSTTSNRQGWRTRGADLARTLLIAAALISALAAWGWTYVIHRVDREIRNHLQIKLSQHYTNHDVRIRSARRLEGRGIEVRGLSIAPRDQPREPVVYIDEIFVDCDAELPDLLTGKLAAREVVVRRAKVRATRLQDGHWDVCALLTPPQLSPEPPPLRIESAELALIDPTRSSEPFLQVRDVHIHASHEDVEPSGGGHASVQHVVRVAGEFSSDHADHIRFAAVYDKSGPWFVQGDVSSLHVSPRLIALLPADVRKHLQATAKISGEVDFRFRASQAQDAPLDFAVNDGVLREGQLTDARLPGTLTDVAGRFHCDPRGIHATITAAMGPTTVYVQSEVDGWNTQATWSVNARLRDVDLNERLYAVLPPLLQVEWRKLSPAGKAHLDATISNRKGRVVVSNGWFQCVDASFSHFRFPYRVQHASGLVRLEDRELWTEQLQAYAGAQIIRLDSHLHDLGPNVHGTTTIRADGPVPLDERVIAAIPGKAREVVASLQPSGLVHLKQMQLVKRDPQSSGFSTSLELAFENGSVRYKHFQYPINKISGRITMRDNVWDFSDLVGYHSSAYIRCSGRWTPSQGAAGPQLLLDFAGTDVPIDDELRLALREQERRIWSQINPRGTIDFVNVRIRFDALRNALTLGITAEKRPQSQNLAGRGIAIKPTWFPLQIEDVTGVVHFENGVVQLQNVRGRHANMAFRIDGRTQCSTDAWSAELTNVVAERIQPTNELLNALPPVLANGLVQLRLQGPFNMTGKLGFSGLCQQGAAPNANWDVRFDVYDGKLASRTPIENIHGSVMLRGVHRPESTWCRGELALDSLMFHGAQFVDVRGPLWVDPQQVLLGSWAERGRTDTVPRQITAKVLGGSFAMDALMQLKEHAPFRFECSLQDGDLSTIARDAFQKREDLRGVTHAMLRLEGNALGPHTYRGDGFVRLRDAQIYETPVMLALLSRLSITEPVSEGDTVDVDFRVQGEHLYFDRVEFRGTAISLYGKEAGWMNLHGGMAMKFYAKVGRRESDIWLLNRMMHEIGRRVLEIEVTGPIDNPEVTNKPFPELDETLQMIFNDEAGSQRTPLMSNRPASGLPQQGAPVTPTNSR